MENTGKALMLLLYCYTVYVLCIALRTQHREKEEKINAAQLVEHNGRRRRGRRRIFERNTSGYGFPDRDKRKEKRGRENTVLVREEEGIKSS